MTRHRGAGILLFVLLLSIPGVASAAWPGLGSGSGTARAVGMPAGPQPTASVSGANVTVSWAAVTLPGGVPVGGYIVKRYDSDGAPATVGASCTGTIAALTCIESSVAPGVWRYTVTPKKGAWQGAESALSAPVTVSTPPAVTGAVIGKSTGGSGGFIRQGATYNVYANATPGAPGPGTLTVSANVGAVSAGQTTVALSAGSWVVDGVTYGFRSAVLTADNPSSGVKSFSVTATYNTMTATSSFTVTVDNGVPSAGDIQTTNAGVPGRIDAGDTIVFTTSETLDPASILSGWTGSAVAVTVEFRNNNGSDRFTIWNGPFTVPANLGTVKLNRTDFLSASVDVAGTMVQSGSTITITLGTPPGSGIITAAGSATMHWTPVATATDRAGNAMASTAVNEGGPLDLDF